MNKEMLKQLWLMLSAFGIMFAVLSWAQESNILSSVSEVGWHKGFMALITGWILYKRVGRKID
jgi:hypothetical protein